MQAGDPGAKEAARMNEIPRIKILDLSTHWSGSVASRHLAHLGADVVKLENPTVGDGNRGLAPFIAGEGLSHVVLNVGKRSVALDRKSSEWEKLLRRFTRWADVVIVGSQPAVAAARALDFASFAARNDRIVYCNISGYGEIGPWANYPLHGLNADVVAGLVPVEMIDGLPSPRIDYRSVGTTLAGIHGALGIMEALRRRDHGAGAQQVFASVWESSMFWQWRDLTSELNLGAPHPAYAELGSRYALYATSDDRVILVCPIERKFWESFCDLLQLPADWRSSGAWETSGMDWGAGRSEERSVIAERMKEHSMEHWLEALSRAGIPFSPLYRAGEAARSRQAEAVKVTSITEVRGRAVEVPNIPIHIAKLGGNETAYGPSTIVPPPLLGEHTDQFLAELASGIQ
jgi:crotonobetainyl-CoA:carnitine CoA-transferase CaiB-like acyl-CoA transferase